jgi:hypothetical protein
MASNQYSSLVFGCRYLHLLLSQESERWGQRAPIDQQFCSDDLVSIKFCSNYLVLERDFEANGSAFGSSDRRGELDKI